MGRQNGKPGSKSAAVKRAQATSDSKVEPRKAGKSAASKGGRSEAEPPLKAEATNHTGKTVTLPCLDASFGDISLYIAVVPVKTLYPLCAISRAKEDPEQGYQRLLSEARAKQIAEYFDSGKAIPGAIVLSAQSDAKLAYDKDTQMLSFVTPAKGAPAFLVIDGQHRLYGAHRAQSNVPMIVSIMTGLAKESEVSYFLDINGTQRGVPPTLQIEVTKFLVDEGSLEDVRIRLFKELNDKPESPLCGRMNATENKAGYLSHVPFKNAVGPLLAKPPLSKAEFDTKLQILINFLAALDEVLTDQSKGDKLSNAAFFTAVFGAFTEISALAKQRHGNYKTSSFAEVVKPLANINWDRFNGTNKKVIAGLTHHIVDLVTPQEMVSESMV